MSSAKFTDLLLKKYSSLTPDVDLMIDTMIKNSLIKSKDDIINDHFACRTFGMHGLGIELLERVFLHYGYEKRDNFFFESKRLNSTWYSPPKDSPHLPRVFISELRVDDFSKDVIDVIKKYTNRVEKAFVNSLNFDNLQDLDTLFHTLLWGVVEYKDYEFLKKHSEYASWTLINGYKINHYTITVGDSLPVGYRNLDEFNSFLEKEGFILNNSGGKIKISGDNNLLQSSTIAKTIEVECLDDNGDLKPYKVIGSFVEMAQRKNGREGFEVANADKIFESTYNKQVAKK